MLFVTDAGGLVSQISFGVNVVAPPPVIFDTFNVFKSYSILTGQTVGPLNFDIEDTFTAVSKLVVTATSSDSALIATSGIAISVNGGSGQLTLTPVAGRTGNATVTVTVADPTGPSVTASLQVMVTSPPPLNTPPTISDVTNQATTLGMATGPTAFTIGDTETAPSSLVVTTTSSNLAVVANAGIVIGGSKANRTVTVNALSVGTSTITITVTDAGGLTATDTFDLTVTTVAVNTPPTISDVVNQTTTVGSANGPIIFTVGDTETASSTLNVTATSSNPAIVANAGIILGGSGANRTVTVNALSVGTSTITITVTDAGGLTATDTFDLTVTAVAGNTPPTISDVTNQTTNGATVGPLAFTVNDAETAVAALAVAGQSNNPTLISSVVVGGSGANRTVTVTPVAGQTGTATIALFVQDGNGASATDTFTVTVNPTPTGTVKPVLVGFPQFAAGSDAGGGNATLFNADKSVRFAVTPFAGFTGGVRTATADFNRDGVADLIVGTGPGIATQVIVYDGKSQAVLFSVAPFEASFIGGVYLSAGDVTGDGIPDLAITPDEGGGPRVDVYSGQRGSRNSPRSSASTIRVSAAGRVPLSRT